jgi:hypothetical protein
MKCDSEITYVLPFLCVGSKTVASDREKLLEAGVTHIINCAGNIYPNYFPDTFRYITLCLSDDSQEDLLSLFPLIIGAIEEAREGETDEYSKYWSSKVNSEKKQPHRIRMHKSYSATLLTFHNMKNITNKSSNVVFVHCHQGVSRSTTVVISYLMWAFLITAECGIKILKKKRGVVHPNYGFFFFFSL